MFNGERARPTTGRLLTTVSPVTYSLPAQLPPRTRSKSDRAFRVSYSTSVLSHLLAKHRAARCPTNISVAIYRRATELIIRACPVSREAACVHRVSRLRQSRDRLTVSDARIRQSNKHSSGFVLLVRWCGGSWITFFFFFSFRNSFSIRPLLNNDRIDF